MIIVLITVGNRSLSKRLHLDSAQVFEASHRGSLAALKWSKGSKRRHYAANP